jgi:hypothetical protein
LDPKTEIAAQPQQRRYHLPKHPSILQNREAIQPNPEANHMHTIFMKQKPAAAPPPSITIASHRPKKQATKKPWYGSGQSHHRKNTRATTTPLVTAICSQPIRIRVRRNRTTTTTTKEQNTNREKNKKKEKTKTTGTGEEENRRRSGQVVRRLTSFSSHHRRRLSTLWKKLWICEGGG